MGLKVELLEVEVEEEKRAIEGEPVAEEKIEKEAKELAAASGEETVIKGEETAKEFEVEQVKKEKLETEPN